MKMTGELWILVASVGLAAVQAAIVSVYMRRQTGNLYAIGPRDEYIPSTGMAGRMERAYRNMLETLPWFAIMVIVTHMTDRTNGTTLAGAYLYFGARVAYVPAYACGIPGLRSVIWWLAGIGILTIASQLF